MSHASTTKTYFWNAEGERHQLNLIWVPGTNGEPYRFGHESASKPIDVAGFFIAATRVTQALWTHVMGHNPSVRPGPRRPVENVSWGDITGPAGFLDRANERILAAIADDNSQLHFRLPAETEW